MTLSCNTAESLLREGCDVEVDGDNHTVDELRRLVLLAKVTGARITIGTSRHLPGHLQQLAASGQRNVAFRLRTVRG